MSTVCIKGIQMSTWCVKCLQQWLYTEKNAACLMLTDISFRTFFVQFAYCLYHLPRTNVSKFRKMNEKITAKRNNICARAWKFCIKKLRMTWKRRLGLYLALVNKMRDRTAEIWWLCVHCIHCPKGKNYQTEFTYYFFSWIAWIKKYSADYLVIFINSRIELNVLCRLIHNVLNCSL